MKTPEQREKNRLRMAKRRAASEELRAYGIANAKAWAAANRERYRLNQKKLRLWWLIGYVESQGLGPPPLFKVIRVVFVILVVLLLISVLLGFVGHPVVRF